MSSMLSLPCSGITDTMIVVYLLEGMKKHVTNENLRSMGSKDCIPKSYVWCLV